MTETVDHLAKPETEPPVKRPKRAGTILGRLAQAVREQNWFAVALELVIVVLGVVIGFQITAWGQERDLRERETAQRAALRADFVETRRRLEATVVGLEPVVGGQRQLLRIMNGVAPRPADGDSMALLINRTFEFQRVEPVLGAYEAMVNAGDLRLISDPDLRAEMALFVDDIAGGFEDEDQALAIRVRLIERLSESNNILAFVRPEWRDFIGAPESATPPDIDALLLDTKFQSYVVAVSFVEASVLGLYRRLIERLDRILIHLGAAHDVGHDAEQVE